MFYVLVIGFFGMYVSFNDFSPFNNDLVNPSEVNLTPSLDPLSMIQKIYFMVVIAADPTFALFSIILTAYSFVMFYIIIKALPFT